MHSNEDLGITLGAPRRCLALHSTERKAGAGGALAPSSLWSGAGGWATSPAPGTQQSPAEAITRLEAENRALRAQMAKLTTQRVILRQGAKCFGRETS